MIMNSVRSLLAPLACMALLISGCSGKFKGKAAAEKAVGEIHQPYNEGEITEIRAAADSKFKNATSENEWSDLMGAVQRKLGQVTSTAKLGFNVRTSNLSTT